MKKKISLILGISILIGCIPCNAFAQYVLSWIKEPSAVYDYVYEFENGLAGVRRGGTVQVEDSTADYPEYEENYHGVINAEGKEIISCSPGNPLFGWGENMGGGYAWITENGKTSFYDYSGEVVSVLPYEDVRYISWGAAKGYFQIATDDAIMLTDVYGNAKISCPRVYDAFNIQDFNSLIKITQYSYEPGKGAIYNVSAYDYSGNCIWSGVDDLGELYFRNGNTVDYIKKDGKYAFVDAAAKLVDGIFYDTMQSMYDYNTIMVSRNGKYGVIGQNRKTVIPCIYDEISKPAQKFADNCYIVINDQSKGIYKADGTLIVPCKYDDIFIHSEDIAACSVSINSGSDVMYDYIDSDGRLIYQKRKSQSAGVGEVDKLKDNLYRTNTGLIDTSGNYILKHNMGYAKMMDSNTVYISDYQGNGIYKKYFYNIKSNTLKELIGYNFISNVIPGAGCLAITKGGKFGLIDVNENVIMPFEYNNISLSEDNKFLKLQKDGKYGLADFKGNILIPCEFDSLSKNAGEYGRISAKKGSTYCYGYIIDDNPEKIIVPGAYDYVYKTSFGFDFEKDGKCGIMDKQGNIIWDAEFDGTGEYYIDNTQCIILRKDGKYGAVDLNKNVLLDFKFDYIELGYDYLLAARDGKYGIFDVKGNEIIPVKYSYLKYEKYIYKTSDGSYVFRLRTDSDDDGRADYYKLAADDGSIIYDGDGGCDYIEYCTSTDTVHVRKDGCWGWASLDEKMPVTVSPSVEGNNLSVSVNNEEDLSGRLIAAFYKNGRNTGMKSIELKQGSNTEQFDLSGIDADSYKVFVWDSERGIIPLSVYKAGKI